MRTIVLFLLFLLPSLLCQEKLLDETPPVIYVSTLSGLFTATNVATGKARWKVQKDQILTVPEVLQENQRFFPDPSDGSLYAVNRGSIEKLPNTIPEMVANSPIKVKDNLYAGRKNDHWVAIRPDTARPRTTTVDDVESCTAISAEQDHQSLYVGKTEYSLTIVDSKTGKETWNVSYVAYRAPELIDPNFEYVFYACSSNGLFSVVKRDTGALLWHARFSSPVITVFVERFGTVLHVPHRTLAADTMTSHLLRDIPAILPEQGPGSGVVGCLFIGKFQGGIYALNEIMHQYDVSSPRPRFPEIGPTDPREVQTIGHHVMPMLPPNLVISQPADSSPSKGTKSRGALPAAAAAEPREEALHTYLNILVGIIGVLVTVMIGVIVLLISMLQKQKSEPSPNQVIANTVSKHILSVGKIDIHMSEIIGHGSEGTVVFKGRFESREVAVKRVLLDFIDVQLHEVELLRQADEHPNVIRYFCMETDSMFRYIALEMCRASLRQYVEGDIYVKNDSQNKMLLEQTIAGIQHLHSLNIVHRDIKPGNILITKGRSGLKALISDFGLCRKISDGRQSMTARTGSAGTDGWIAPEMLLPSTKISHAVDIFSYGCIMYYVLSGGQHPFGSDCFRRQNNILNNDYDLSELSAQTQDNVLAASLIVQMVGSKDRNNRPTATAITKHPYFWSADKILRYYSDVSDRVEKEETSELVLRWEHNSAGPVLRGGWIQICEDLVKDLNKYRKYNSASVRDLLRAMRNKHHHHRELPAEVREKLGEIPDGFLAYFSSRFPRLLLHTYTIMWQCRNESIFKVYYPEIATFTEQRKETEGELHPRPLVALDREGKYSTDEVVPEYLELLEQKAERKRKKTVIRQIAFKPPEELSARPSSREPTPEPPPPSRRSVTPATLSNKFGLLETNTDSESENTPPRSQTPARGVTPPAPSRSISPPPGFGSPSISNSKPWYSDYELTSGYAGHSLERTEDGLVHRVPRTYLVPEM